MVVLMVGLLVVLSKKSLLAVEESTSQSRIFEGLSSTLHRYHLEPLYQTLSLVHIVVETLRVRLQPKITTV